MAIPNPVDKFLQAVFGSDYGTHAIFAYTVANPGPKAKKMEHVRTLAELDSERDCYWSIAAFPPGYTGTNTEDAALEVRALVIDDVGTKGPSEGAVLLALGKPTAITRTSTGNYQWAYRLLKPVAKDDWGGFFGGIEALIGHAKPLEARAAQTLMRLPMGINTKGPDTNGKMKLDHGGTFKVELVKINPGVTLDPDKIVRVSGRSRRAKTSSSGGWAHDIAGLMALIPNNDVHYDDWFAHAERAMAAAIDKDAARPAFEAWSEKSEKHDPAEIELRWPSVDPTRTSGKELLSEAEAADPEGYKVWQVREEDTAFDDGVIHPETPKGKSAPHVLASGEFVEGFIPPDYLVKKLITKAFLYSLTGQTGAGKTSITLRLAATVALGRSFGGLGSKPCRVLYLAAENPIDIQMRWIALGAEMGFDVNTIGVFFVKGGFRISATMKTLKAEALRVGGDFGLVVVDTGPVFFEGEDENDRTAQRKHARMMRELIEVIPGKPAVIVNVHPVKNAGADNLLPSGGGSFLNEVDGNLTAAKNADQTIELHWQGKWRGVEFAPLHFLLRTVTHPRLVDRDGEAMPTVVCDHLSIGAKEDMEKKADTDQDEMLAEMMRHPRVSVAELAVHMGWYYRTGEPDKSKVQRYVKKLRVKREHQLWVVAGMPKSKMN